MITPESNAIHPVTDPSRLTYAVRPRPSLAGDGTTLECVWRDAPQWAAVPELTWRRLGAPRRLIVLSPHPGDETFAAGGLIALAHHHGARIDFVLATAGEASHPNSPTLGPAERARRHLWEARTAMGLLAPAAECAFLRLRDGHLADQEDVLTDRLTQVVGDDIDGAVLLAPYRHDGYADHDAAGRAGAKVAANAGISLWEVPTVMWHWSAVDNAPWASMSQVPLPKAAVMRKIRAMACFTSLIDPLSPLPGDEPVVGAEMVAHFERDHEVLIGAFAID